ncbi:MAG: hypothetical protein ABJZ55_20620 [Fuerstiella sp.]
MMKRVLSTSPLRHALSPSQHSARSGAVAMIMVIAVTIIGTILLTQGVRSVLNERRTMPANFQQQQANHLLQSGIRRLKALPSSDDVQSGAWKFTKGTIHETQTGEVKVQVQDGTITVSATYPLESETPVTVSESFTKEFFIKQTRAPNSSQRNE